MTRILRFIGPIALAVVAGEGAADFSGTWVGSWETEGRRDQICLALAQDDRGVEGNLAYRHDTEYAPITAHVTTANDVAFKIADKNRGEIRFRLTAAGLGLSGEARAGNRIEPVALKRYSPSKIYYRFGAAPATPVAIQTAGPEYSEQARAAKLEGTVLLLVPIQSSGIVGTDIKVIRGLGSGLDEKAIECVKRWKFSPPRLDCQPARSLAQVEVHFRLP
jgi:TonB family protein